MIYDEIQEMIKNIFASRAKNISDKIVDVWAKEISTRGFTDFGLKDAEKELMADDEVDLTLPKVLAIIYKNNRKYKTTIKKENCAYCNGMGYVYSTLFFNKEGLYESSSCALRCYHNNEDDKGAKMVLNEETHHKTEVKDGYILVFKDIVEREAYLQKVEANNWYDLWVEQETPKGELVPFYPPKEEELVGENLVIPEPKEDVPEDEETIPF